MTNAKQQYNNYKIIVDINIILCYNVFEVKGKKIKSLTKKMRKNKFKGEIIMKSKVYLDRQEIWFIINYLAEQVRRNTRFMDAETTFEDLIFETQEIVDEKNEDDLLWEIEESNFYFQYNGEDVPNMNEMLARYIRFANENDVDGGTDVADILNKAERIRELVKGYLFEILVFFANQYGIPKNEEMTETEIGTKILKAFKDMKNIDETEIIDFELKNTLIEINKIYG